LEPADDFTDGRFGQPSTVAPANKTQVDAGATVPGVPGPTKYDCLGDVGPSHPQAFESMSGWAQVGTCPGSSCVDFVDMDASCVYGLQVNNIRSTATIETQNCEALKRWFTSDVLLAGLGSKCGGVTGAESLEIEGTSPVSSGRKKFDGCTEEPFPSHRACLAKIRAKYFPGK